jgi:hypothetical protein
LGLFLGRDTKSKEYPLALENINLDKNKTKERQKKSLANLLMQNDQLKKRVDTTIRLLNQLVADRSTTELLRNKGRFDLLEFNSRSQPVNNMRDWLKEREIE